MPFTFTLIVPDLASPVLSLLVVHELAVPKLFSNSKSATLVIDVEPTELVMPTSETNI